MSRIRIPLVVAMAVVLSFPTPAQTDSRLKIDPALLVYLAQCREVMRGAGDRIWSGWDFAKAPVLFYRPGVQDVLVGFPHRPEGFQPLTGFNPLGSETVYYRDGATFIDIDGQNTVTDIDGVRALVVADTYSNQRNQLSGVLAGRDKEFAAKWLEAWSFLPDDPYDQMAMILHEGFHAWQETRAPGKGPDETAAIDYPLLDAPNNASWAVEAALMRDALLAGSPEARAGKIRQLVAVRSERRTALKPEWIAYEDRTEFLEGLAKSVELGFLRAARDMTPDPRLFYVHGFHGFGQKLDEVRTRKIESMKDIIAASIDMTGNPYGVGPLRFRLYSSGAALAMLLDEAAPGWKSDVFEEGVFLFDLLREAVPLTDAERASLAARAREEYGYRALLEDKTRFENEGRNALSDKVKAILETPDTLVIIDYSGPGGIAGMAFTPFGVTKVAESQAIYDMVPLRGRFADGSEFGFKKVVPVLVDKAVQRMSFAVRAAAPAIVSPSGAEVQADDFSLTGGRYAIEASGNRVVIRLLRK